MEEKYYLKQNIAIEPLVFNWYAMPFLIPPTTLSLYIRDYVALMKSYLASPEMHELASKDPNMIGGSFLNLPKEKVSEVKQLLDQAEQTNLSKIAFADSIVALNKFLISEAKGMSLEGLYSEVPDTLKGYVELLYDVNNQPGFRFFESMLYHGPIYDTQGQSLLFYELGQEQRGYVSNTPRFKEDGMLHMQLPFSSDKIDEIAKLREQPQEESHIRDLFGMNGELDFEKFFTPNIPEKPTDRNYQEEGIRVRFYGHACVLVETKDVSILVDPFINYSDDQTDVNFTMADLPDQIDYVLITHSHGDHIIPEYLLQLRFKIKNIVIPRNGNGNLEDPSLKLLLKSIGFHQVIELDELDSIKIPGGEIIGMPFLGEHCDLTIRSKILHLIKLQGKSMLLASDSSNLEVQVYRLLRELIGSIDIVFIGMESEGAPLSFNYGPFMPVELNRKMDQSRRVNGSNFESAYAIVKEFQPKEIYVYAMGLEPWTEYILGIQYTEEAVQLREANKLIDTCMSEGIHAELLEAKKELVFRN